MNKTKNNGTFTLKANSHFDVLGVEGKRDYLG